MKIELKTRQQEEYKETELGPLPVEWSVVRIGDVFDVKQGKQLSSKESKEGKSLKPFLRTSNVLWGKINIATIDQMPFSTEEFNKLILKHGDVLVCEGGAIGRTALWNAPITECAYQNHLHRLRVKKEGSTFPHFFVFWMEYAISQRRLYINDANVTTIPNLSQSRLKNFKILHPPLPEQHRIAAVLSAVQDAKEKTGTVIAAAKSLKKSLMRHLFTYGPVSAGAAESVPLTETEIGLVPEGWDVVRLGEVIRGTQYGLSLRGNQQGRYPILRMSNLIDGRVNTSDLQYVDLDEDSFSKFRLNGGDILFNRTNSFELVGKTALFCVCDDFVFASYLIRVVPDTVMLVPEYLNYYLNWDTSQIRLKTLSSRGVSQSNINATKLKGFSIPLPPLPLQQKIAFILSTVDKKIETEENKKKALDELFRSLLHNLMTAKIRVNHLEVVQ
ncbi:MAG: restriction endonuclease subunit S [Methanosarcinaceae archaeon]